MIIGMSTYERCYVRVNPNPQQLRAWRKHISLPTHPDQLSGEDLYAAAIPLLNRVRHAMMARGWRRIQPRAGELWSVVPPKRGLGVVEEEDEEDDSGRSSSSSRSSVIASPTSPTTHVFSVPADLRSLAVYASKWDEIFTNEMFYRANQHPEYGLILSSPVSSSLVDVFYLIQLILPGALTLVKEHHDDTLFSTKETRPLPPLAWMMGQSAALIPIFGEAYWSVLMLRARDGLSTLDILDT